MATGIVNPFLSTLVADESYINADDTSVVTITATAIDGDSSVVTENDLLLEIIANGDGVTITDPTLESGAIDGVAEFEASSDTIHVGEDATVFRCTSVEDGVVFQQTVTVEFYGSDAAESTVAAADGKCLANNTETETITVTLLDGEGDPVEDHEVELECITTETGITISAASGLSNASGVVTFTVKSSAWYAASQFKATDVTNGVEITQVATVRFYENATTSAGDSTCEADPVLAPADDDTTSEITVTLLTSGSAAVKGHSVTLSATAYDTGVTIVGSPGVTNASGVVAFTAKSTTVHHSAAKTVFTAVDADLTTTVTETASVTFYEDSEIDQAKTTVAATDGVCVADDNETETITVTLKDASNGGIEGHEVELTAISSSTGVTIGAASGVSDSSGVVTFAVKSDTAHAETYFQAEDVTLGVTLLDTVAVRFAADAATDADESTCVAASEYVLANNTATTTVTVTFLTAAGLPVVGHAVTLTADPSTAVTVTTSPSVTNASGVATFTVKSSAAASTAVEFTAEDTDDSTTVKQTAEIVFYGTLAYAETTDLLFYIDRHSEDSALNTYTRGVTVNGTPAIPATATLTASASWLGVPSTCAEDTEFTVTLTDDADLQMGNRERHDTESITVACDGYEDLSIPVTFHACARVP